MRGLRLSGAIVAAMLSAGFASDAWPDFRSTGGGPPRHRSPGDRAHKRMKHRRASGR